VIHQGTSAAAAETSAGRPMPLFQGQKAEHRLSAVLGLSLSDVVVVGHSLRSSLSDGLTVPHGLALAMQMLEVRQNYFAVWTQFIQTVSKKVSQGGFRPPCEREFVSREREGQARPPRGTSGGWPGSARRNAQCERAQRNRGRRREKSWMVGILPLPSASGTSRNIQHGGWEATQSERITRLEPLFSLNRVRRDSAGCALIDGACATCGAGTRRFSRWVRACAFDGNRYAATIAAAMLLLDVSQRGALRRWCDAPCSCAEGAAGRSRREARNDRARCAKAS
jgi:hypothetical protein